MEVKIQISESCKKCKEAFKYFKKLHRQNKKAYGGFIIKPTPKSDKEFMSNRIRGLILTPDYNSGGHLTHFHMSIEQNMEHNLIT